MATLGFKAKGAKLHDDLDEFDFGSMDFDVEDPPDDRHPALKVLSPVGNGIKDYVSNSGNIERFVKQAMPVGYGQLYDKGSETAGDLRQLYNGIQKELRPVKETSKKMLRKLLPKLDGKLPKGLLGKLEEMSAGETQWQGRQGADKESQLANTLTTIFENQQQNKVEARADTDEREKIKQGFEQIRHRDSMGQLDSIRIGVESLTQYQNNITFNVQKKQLELNYRQFWAMVDLVGEQKRSNSEMLAEMKATRKNTALPDFVKQTTHERFKELARNKFLENVREGMFGGSGDYIRKLTKNVSEQALGRVRDYSNTISGVGDMADGVSDMAGDMPGFNARDEMIRMGMSLPMDWLANKGAAKLGNALGKNSAVRRGGARANYLVNTAGDRIHKNLTDPTTNWGPLEFLREALARAAPTKTPDSKMEVDSLNKAHEPKPFNRSNSKSLDEIIPGLLSRIHREIRILRTGDENAELITYDFTKNKFSTDKKVISALRDRIAGAGADRATKYSEEIISKINRNNSLTPAQKEIARKQLIEKSVMGESIDSTKISQSSNWGGGEDGEAIAKAFNRYLRSEGGVLPDNQKSYERQVNLIQNHRAIVSGLGDPRVLLQQLVNAGQLENLKESGVIDEAGNVDRKVFAKWLSEKQIAEQPTPPETNGGKKKKPKQKPTPVIPVDQPSPALEPLRQAPSGNNSDIVNALKVISDQLAIPKTAPEPVANTIEKNVQSITELLKSLAENYEQESTVHNSTLLNIYDQLQRFGNNTHNPTPGEGDPQPNGPKLYSSLYDHLKDKAKAKYANLSETAIKKARRAKRKAGVWWSKGGSKATEAAYKVKEVAGRRITDLKGKLSKIHGDVFLPGETQARLRQALLEAGYYRDKITGKVITSLADIKNDIIDPDGNVVITLEEFYKSYIGGDIRKKVSDVFKTLKEKVLNLGSTLKTAIPQKLEQLKQFAAKTVKKLKDSMPAFDVYCKADMTKPVLYASMMRYDGYFSKKTTKPIKHPSDIDGEVVDTKGNIVVNEQQIKDGLVDVAGVPIGNELTRLAGRALKYVGAGLQALRVAAGAGWAGLKKGATGFKDYIKDFTLPLSEIVINSKRSVTLLEQIHKLLDDRLPGKKTRGDLSGDGIRDGSIEDIKLKKAAAEKIKQAKEAAKAALDKGNASASETYKKLKDAINKKKDGGKSLLDKAKDKARAKAKGILGKFGLGGVGDLVLGGDEDEEDNSESTNGDSSDSGDSGREDNRTDKEKKRDKAKERLKRMRKSARARQAAAARGRFTSGARTRLGNLGNRVRGSRLFNTNLVRGGARGAGRMVNNPLTRGVARGAGGLARFAGRAVAGTGRALTGPGRLGRLARWGAFNTDIVRGGGRLLAGGGRLAAGLGGAAMPLIGKAGAIGAAVYGANELRKTIFDKEKDTEEKIQGVADTGIQMAGGLAGAKAGAMAGAAAGSVVPVIGTAIGGVLGGLIGGGLGYWGAGKLNDKRKGFGAWWNKAKLSNLSKLRLAQYGVSSEDKDNADHVLLLESTLEPYMTLKEDGNLVLDTKKVDLMKVAKDFGVTDEQDIKLFNQWYKGRFIPVYRKWLSIIRKIKPEGKLADVEAIIPATDKLKVAEETVSSLADSFSNMTGWSRGFLRLTYDGSGVQQVLSDMRITLQKEAQAAGGPEAKATANTSSVSSIKDANTLAQKALTDKATYVTKDKDGKTIDPASMSVEALTDKIKKGEVTVEVGIALPKNLLHNDSNQLDALTSIRFKAYGLTSLVADKARMLGALEDYLADNINTDAGDPKLSISTDQILKAAGDVFGVPNGSGEHARRWRGWFNGRFLPVFLIYVGALRKATGKKNLKDAKATLPMTEQAAIARAIIGAQGIGEMGNTTSIWSITTNPWSTSYELNTDPDTTAGNMEAIRLVADKVKLGEVTAKDGKVIQTGKPEGFFSKTLDTVSKTFDKVKNFFGFDTKPKGEGVRATGDTMVKNPTPITGMGDPISFSGGGGGNYLDLPKPTGAGWGANKDLIIAAAKMAGVDPKALITTIAVESSFNPNAAAKTTTAKGLGQHVDGSWQEDLQRDGKKFGIPNGTNQFDPRASALMTASRLRFNGQQLAKNLGRPATVTDLYLAHLMGLGGATKFLKAPADAIGAEVGGAAAKQHPNYFYGPGGKALTVKEVYAGFTQKLSKRPAELGVDQDSMKSTGASATTPNPATSAPSSGVPMSGKVSAGTTGVTPSAPTATPPQANFANTPAAGTPQLHGPIETTKGKEAIMGTGPKMVVAKGVTYELVLQREESEEDGTYGTLRFPDGTVLNTLELAWKDNAPRVSSIPPGTYPCKPRSTSNHGTAYELQNVQGRSAILIHAGNAAGSAALNMKADSQGCILLGMGRARKGSQKVITASKPAMAMFNEKLGGQPFTLVIRPGKAGITTTPAQPAVNFDPVRAPSATPVAAAKVNATPSVAFTPGATNTVASTIGASVLAGDSIPRLSSTMTSFNPGSPSKTEMQQRDKAISETIAPKLDSISKILEIGKDASVSSAETLVKIYDFLSKQKPGETPTAESNSGNSRDKAIKLKPITNTNVPIPQKRDW